MSEGHSEEHPEDAAAPAEPVPGPPSAPDPARPPRHGSRSAALWLAVLLVLILAGVGLSPFWAPDLAPLLPWGGEPDNSADQYAALAARISALERRPPPTAVDSDTLKSAISALTHRVDQLEKGIDARFAELQNRPAPVGADIGAINAALSDVTRRVEQLDRRVSAGEGQTASRMSSEAADLQNLQQEVARLGKSEADFAERLAGFERTAQAQKGAEQADALLALVLLQIDAAVEHGRPFRGEYDLFTSVARDPRLMAAAAPLAEPARTGVPSRLVLTKRLAELAGTIATTTEPTAESDWGGQALARLRGLVTIRRIDGAKQTGPETAVSSAQTALAGGDLAGAVTALETLAGANAEAARSWLNMARGRLAVETALDHLQQLLTARLSAVSGGPREAPAKAPDEPSATPRTPS
jgi:hypothetical protein